MPTKKIFFFDWNSNFDADLPAWAQDSKMFIGQYVSLRGLPTSWRNTKQAIASNRSGKVTNGFMKALIRAAMIDSGANADGFGLNDRYAMGEMTLDGIFTGTTINANGLVACVLYDRTTGKFLKSSGYDHKTNGSAPYFLALWNYFMESMPDFAPTFNNFCTEWKQSPMNEDVCRSMACVLADMVYEHVQSDKFLCCDKDEIRDLTETRMRSSTTKPAQYTGILAHFGQVTRGRNKSANPDGRVMSTADFCGKFSFRTEPLSAEQEKLVPKLTESYIVDEWLVLVCKHIQKTTGRPRPVRNILLRGAPGVGKSEMYTGIAAGCHLPLYTFAANAMTEPFDLFGQFVPVDENGEQCGGKMSLRQILKDMPSVEDFSMDPVYTYEELTGEKKSDATSLDCMAAAFTKASQQTATPSGQQRFKFVPGQLITAMKFGGVWGFDEVTLPQNPGVVPALNPAMDATQSITLPTGEIVRRHPDCIFVGTTNLDLEGCRNLNQAWQDRCQLIIDLPEPTEEVLKARVKSMVNWDEANDSKIVDLDRFISVYRSLQEIARKHRLEDGVIGPRKLADWVLSTLVTENPNQSAQITIIPGATSDARGIAEMKEKLEDSFPA